MFDPKKVGEEADRMIAELTQGAAPSAPQTEEPADAAGATETTENIDTQAAAAPVAADTPPSTQTDLALAELKKQLDAAENRWKSLQGMIDKKDEELENMRVLFAQLQSTPPASTPDEPPRLTDADAKDFDPDLVSYIKRMSAQVARDIVHDELAKFKPTIDRVEQTATDTRKTAEELAYDRFTERLAEHVEDWEQLNVAPGFLAWLDKVDEFVGVRRLVLLRDAFTKLDALRVARFFLAYKDEAGLNKPETPTVTTPPAPPANVAQFVAPAKSRSTPQVPETPSAKQWSRADISKLYDDKMRGLITSSEFEKQERDLFKAQREGRVAA